MNRLRAHGGRHDLVLAEAEQAGDILAIDHVAE
jgi:hypothetical protein